MGLRWDDAALAGRFAGHIDDLEASLGHKNRDDPFRRYCAGLLLPGARKSVEPMVGRLAPERLSAARLLEREISRSVLKIGQSSMMM